MDEERGMSRRSFVGLLAGALASIPAAALARSWLRIEYVLKASKLLNTKEVALKVPLRYGVSYNLMARLYTSSESNADEIMVFNDNLKLIYIPGKERYMYIPRRLVSDYIRKILDENKFSTFEIESQGEQGINTLWDIANGFLNDNLDMNKKINILLILNDEVNPTTALVYDEQKILVPDSLINTKNIVNDETPERETPVARAATRVNTRQNPYRVDINYITRRLRARDLFGARRTRSLGRRRYRVIRHTGIDLVAPIGTRLYPIEDGVVLSAGRDRRLWRNGNLVRYQTNSGLVVTYIHMQRVNVIANQRITKTSVLGTVGITGNASRNNPHVHIQVRSGSRIIDPRLYVVVDA